MGVKCEIFIQTTQNDFFRPGQPVVGTVVYFIDKPTKFKTIDIFFLGKGTCEWSESGPNSTSIQYFNDEEYVNHNRNLFKAQNDHEVFLAGNFEYPFDFLLPDDIPSSIKVGSSSNIEYKVNVKFVKAKGFNTTQEHSKEIRVYGYVSPCSPEPRKFDLQKNLFSLTSNNNIDVKAKIEKTCLTPGECMKLDLSILNESVVPFTINIQLIKYFTFISKKNKTKVVNMPLENWTYSTSIVEKSLSLITCLVPTPPKLYSIQYSKILKGEYIVRVTVKLPFPYNDADVDVPIVIGERKDQVEAAAMDTDYENLSTSNVPEIVVENLVDV